MFQVTDYHHCILEFGWVELYWNSPKYHYFICICGSAGKESACNAGDLGSIPGYGKTPWRRERLPTPVFWPGESHGLYSPWDHKESDTTEGLSLQFTSFVFVVERYSTFSFLSLSPFFLKNKTKENNPSLLLWENISWESKHILPNSNFYFLFLVLGLDAVLPGECKNGYSKRYCLCIFVVL